MNYYKTKLTLIITALNCIFSFNDCLAQSMKTDFMDISSAISKNNLMQTVKVLSSREFAGRLSGSDGYNKAAEYMAGEFQKINLISFGDEKFFQFLNVEYNEIKPKYSFSKINNEGMKHSFQLGKDFVFRGFTGSGKLASKVVFCGYGLSLKAYDDYKDVSVKDKVVIAFKYNPKWSLPNIKWADGYPRAKSNAAAERGAKGILFVSFPNDEQPQKPIGSILHGEGEQNENFPQLHIDIAAADEFLRGSGYTLKELQTIIDSTKKSFSIELNSTAEIEVHTEYNKTQSTMNVAGLFEGTDEKLKDEYLIVGAHLDHVGQQAGEIYFPGANDNASGSAALLEIARALRSCGIQTKRSIIFALFASEEQGLFGSKYFADHLPVPIEKIAAMFNLDCVGYGDSIQVGNGKSAPALWSLAAKNDSLYTKMMVQNTWSGGGADANPFHEKGIPSLYFVTTNSYEHLHQTTDTPGSLNYELFEKITRLAFFTIIDAANGNYSREIVAD